MPNVHVVMINVNDMDVALDFYCAKLGFEVYKTYTPDIVQLENDGVWLLLSRVASLTVIESSSHPPVSLLIEIEANSLADVLRDLHSKGVELVHTEPQRSPMGYFAHIKDPFGNILEVVRAMS